MTGEGQDDSATGSGTAPRPKPNPPPPRPPPRGHRSLDDEAEAARGIRSEGPVHNLGTAIHELFGSLGGVDLEIPRREAEGGSTRPSADSGPAHHER